MSGVNGIGLSPDEQAIAGAWLQQSMLVKSAAWMEGPAGRVRAVAKRP
jgi:hypothetical protein